MNKKQAFTLTEVLLVLMIIGTLAVLMLRSLSTESFERKAFVAQGYKTMESFEQASIKIRDIEQDSCPTGQFITDVAGVDEFVLINSSTSNPMTSNEVYELYKKYLRYSNATILNFCNVSGYCNTVAEESKNKIQIDSKNIAAGKLPTGAYFGIEVTGIIACPDYYLPEYENLRTGEGKCWGKLYIDANGTKGPNALGQDVFVFGLNKDGINR